MGFEDKINKMEPLITTKEKTKLKEVNEPRISKSYTLKRNLAEELARQAKEQDLTASRYLENILKKHL